MKSIFYNAVAVMVLIAPLLMATQCVRDPYRPEREEEDCEIDCIVWVNYVDEKGEKIPFGTNGYPDEVYYIRAEGWVDLITNKHLDSHNYGGHDYPKDARLKRLAHGWFAAAAARNSLMHPKVKGVVRTVFETYPSLDIVDDVEVELYYNTPANAYIKLIKINGEVKWDRSSFPDGKVPEDIIIDYYLDINRLKELM